MLSDEVVIDCSDNEETNDANTHPRQLTDEKIFCRLRQRGAVNLNETDGR
jgi:hypothetical protein